MIKTPHRRVFIKFCSAVSLTVTFGELVKDIDRASVGVGRVTHGCGDGSVSGILRVSPGCVTSKLAAAGGGRVLISQLLQSPYTSNAAILNPWGATGH